MGLFSFLKKKKGDEYQKYSQVIGTDYYPPIFSQFGSNIYASDVVQQAISCITREMSKLEPRHVQKKDLNTVICVNDSIQSTLDNPNILMTTKDFIEKIIWQLFFNYNAFVFPDWKEGKLIGLYPLTPKHVDFLQDNSGEMFIKLTFANEYEIVIEYSRIIHIRYNFSVNEFMGGNVMGEPDHEALLKSLELNSILLEGVGKALKSSFAINGIVKYNTMIDKGKVEEDINEMTNKLRNNDSGFLPMDIKGEFIPLKKEIQLVDEATLKFIDEKILRHFGVPRCILTGDYTKEQYEAFFQSSIEPLIVSLSQSFTKSIFSKRESFGYGHKIIFYHDKLDFMSMNDKERWGTLLSNVGAITVNELRGMIGYSPVADEEVGNMLIMSKNFGSVDSVKDIDKNKNILNNDGGGENDS